MTAPIAAATPSTMSRCAVVRALHRSLVIQAMTPSGTPAASNASQAPRLRDNTSAAAMTPSRIPANSVPIERRAVTPQYTIVGATIAER